jgi:hypothetical protein
MMLMMMRRTTRRASWRQPAQGHQPSGGCARLLTASRQLQVLPKLWIKSLANWQWLVLAPEPLVWQCMSCSVCHAGHHTARLQVLLMEQFAV